ncbi:MAG: hypothetical protein ABSD03_16140 [Vulcanimicrobiaceae bacterium]
MTQTFAFLARRGAGKSYGAMKLAEGMLDIGAQIVALDPVGVWYSLRIGADGKSKGFDLPIFGGLHGDVPLEPEAGAFIADLIIDRGISVVLDVSQMRKHDRKKFATDFAEQLFHRKKQRRSPMHFFVEEAQVFVPQNAATSGGERHPKGGFYSDARMLGAFEDIVKLGRNFGIGATLISQRPQSVNKDALNQTEALFVLQTNGAQERKALENWIVEQGVGTKALVDELPGLPIGTAYLWSPSWLHKLEKVKIGKRRTYDASATPVAGVEHVEPRPLSAAELAEVEKAMAVTIERAKADDPKALRATIADLQRQLRDRAPGPDPGEVAQLRATIAHLEAREPERVEVSVLTDVDRTLLRAVVEEFVVQGAAHRSALDHGLSALTAVVHQLSSAVEQPARGPAKVVLPERGETFNGHRRTAAAPRRQPAPRPESAVCAPSDAGDLAVAPSAVLMAVAERPDGVATRAQVAALTGYSVRKSTLRNALSALRTRGLIETIDDEIQLTPAGRRLSGPPPRPKTTEETIALWRGKLASAPLAVLDVLIASYPKFLTRDEAGTRASVDPTKSTLRNALSALRVQGLIEESGDELRASETLFPTGKPR